MRLSVASKSCGFESTLEKELERQFVFNCNMPEVENKVAMSVDSKKMTWVKIQTYAFNRN